MAYTIPDRTHCIIGVITMLLCVPDVAGAQQPTGNGLTPFRNDAEFAEYFRVRYSTARMTTSEVPSKPCTAEMRVVVDSSGPRMGSARISGRVVDAADTTRGRLGVLVATRNMAQRVQTDTAGAFDLLIPADSLPVPTSVTVTARALGLDPRSVTLPLGRGMAARLSVPMCTGVVALSAVSVTSASGAPSSDAITNIQVAGVDEGGIVKRRGRHLIVLRRGRLFTIDVGDGHLRPVAAINAFGPDIDARRTWYDELLVSEDRVVVIGYSYQRGGTEIGLFRLGPDGELQHLDTYQLTGSDYYSSENYASRLLGSRLIFYTPIYTWGRSRDTVPRLPSLRRWRAPRGAADSAVFRRLAGGDRVFRVAAADDGSPPEMMHAVVSCDLRTTPLECSTTTVIGGYGDVFHVSQTAVYVAATGWRSRDRTWPTTLYRIPLDGAVPTAAVVTGAPLDQFSFLEQGDRLAVLLREHGLGDGMWRAERPAHGLSLLRLRLADFGDGSDAVPASAYQRLPDPTVGSALQNRFVGSSLLYGTGAGWSRPKPVRDSLYVVELDSRHVTALPIEHGVDRIEVMGRSAVAIGATKADLHFTGIGLGDAPRQTHRFILREASQGETRSHGFFSRPDEDNADKGLVGLPVSTAGQSGWRQLREGSAGVFFLRNAGKYFESAGTLDADGRRLPDDGCVASCMDWYGNARPLFVDDRIIALLGYELVEGRMFDHSIREVRRVSFAPEPGKR